MLRKGSIATTATIAALVALGPMSTDMYLPAMPSMATDLDTGIDQIQLTLSIFLGGFAVSQLVYGALSDRFGRKPVLLGSLLLFIVASFGCSTADSVGELIGWRFLQAIGACAGPVLGRAMVRDIHGARGSARILSYMGAAMALAPAVAPLAGGYLVVAYGWPSVFLLLCAYGLALAVIITLAIPETVSHKDPLAVRPIIMAGNIAGLLSHRSFVGYMLCCSFVFAGVFGFLSGSSFVIIDHFGFAEQDFGLLFALVVFGYMTGTVFAGRRSRSLGPDPLIRRGSLISGLAGSVMLGLTLFEVDSVVAIIAPMVIYMVGVGIVMPQSMAGALAPFPSMAGAASAVFGFVQMSIAALAGVLVGQFHDGGPLSMATVIAGMGLASLTTYQLMIRKPAAAAA